MLKKPCVEERCDETCMPSQLFFSLVDNDTLLVDTNLKLTLKKKKLNSLSKMSANLRIYGLFDLVGIFARASPVLEYFCLLVSHSLLGSHSSLPPSLAPCFLAGFLVGWLAVL